MPPTFMPFLIISSNTCYFPPIFTLNYINTILHSSFIFVWKSKKSTRKKNVVAIIRRWSLDVWYWGTRGPQTRLRGHYGTRWRRLVSERQLSPGLIRAGESFYVKFLNYVMHVALCRDDLLFEILLRSF